MKKVWILLTVLLLALAGCTNNQNETNDKLSVITSLFPQYDFVREIGKDKVDVSLLLSPGVESHAFDPTPSQIIAITQSDLFIYTNPEMEPWIDQIVENVKDDGTLILESSKGIQFIEGSHDHSEDEHDDEDHDDQNEQDEHDEDHLVDPHVWLDPLNAKIMVTNISNALIELDPENEAFYTENTNAYLAKLDDLNDTFEEVFNERPNDTIIYGGHFAFGYLADRFDLTILSPYTGFSPDAEPTANAISELIKTIEVKNIKIIFFEELIEPRVANVIAEQTNTTPMLLHGAHNVTKQEMDSNITYIEIMHENAEKLKEALNYE